jgi:hypothetical protein
MELHRLAGDYFSKFEKTVIKLYSRSPYNNEELTNIINELPDEKVRERIVKATNDFETNTSKTDPDDADSAAGGGITFNDDEIYAGGPVEQAGINGADTAKDWANPGTNSKQP